MGQTKLKQAVADQLTPIEDVAAYWEVDVNTVKKWVDVVYLAFDVQLTKGGPYPDWGVSLIRMVGMHISKRSSFYFAETQESRRLKSSEFVKKIRALRQQGHFAEFQKFQKFQNFQPLLEGDEEDEELETLSELAAIAQKQDEQLHNAKLCFETREDEQIEGLATFIEGSDRRRMQKLANRLKQAPVEQNQITGTDQVLDVSFRRLPG